MPAVPRTLALDTRARIMWGEPPEKVITFLQGKGVSHDSAIALLAEFVEEREADIRQDGIRIFCLGLLGAIAPLVVWCLTFMGYLGSTKLLVASAGFGVFGIWRVGKGYAMMTRPASIRGSLANRED
jgi:hypothetical protein